MKRAFKTIGIFLSAILLLASCSSDDDEILDETPDIEAIETLQDARIVTQLKYTKEKYWVQGTYMEANSKGLTPFYVRTKNEKGKELINSLITKGDLSYNKEDGLYTGKYRIESPDLYVSDFYKEFDSPADDVITIKMKSGYKIEDLINEYPQLLKLERSNILGYHDVYCDVINSHELFKVINLLAKRKDVLMVKPNVFGKLA